VEETAESGSKVTDPVVQNALSVGGYILSLLLGIVIFLAKREVARLDGKLSEIQKSHLESVADHRAHDERHAERHLEDAEKLEIKRDELSKSIQALRADLLGHCAEANNRFLTKDEFISSTTYLTKKTDEVSRLLQSIENAIVRR
jgi:hypothetical protein